MQNQISQQDAQKAFESEVEKQLVKWQNDTIFNKALLPGNFSDLIAEAFAYNSPFNLRMAVDYFKQTVENRNNEYTLMEMGTILHVCKLRNAHELGMDMPEYVKFQEDIEVLSREYLKIVSGKQESIQRKLQATIRSEQSVPEGKKTVAFPKPTAQA